MADGIWDLIQCLKVKYHSALCALLHIQQVSTYKVRECYHYILCTSVLFDNNCHSKITWLYNFLVTVVCKFFRIFSWHCLMNNELKKVKYEPKPRLLCDRWQRKQQPWKFEILQFSEVSYVVSDLCYCYVKNKILCS